MIITLCIIAWLITGATGSAGLLLAYALAQKVGGGHEGNEF